MKAILNSQVFEIEDLPLALGNRAFKYGDGLFETIALPKGKPRLLDYHLQRLSEGADYLHLDYSNILNQKKAASHISQLQELNSVEGDAIVKLHIWRNAVGKYAVMNTDADSLITLEKTAFNKFSVLKRADFSEKTINYASGFSQFKTMNALKYVIAGNEKLEKGLDEIIILDQKGFISEALSSNIFWKKADKFFTAPISTGCISGVMRRWIIEKLTENGLEIHEKLVGKNEFLESDCIFTSNASGIAHISSIGSLQFEIDAVAQQLIEQVF